MAEYIEREKAYTLAKKICDAVNSGTRTLFLGRDILDWIDDIPAADVRPVVRGHWIGTKEAEEMGDIMKEFTCSVCGCCDWDCTESESFNYCPNCGARMEES